MSRIIISLSASIAAILINLILTPLILKLSHKFKWYDLPDNRKIHKGLIPRLGGVGIFFSFMIAVCVTSFLFMTFSHINYIFHINFLYLSAGIILIHLMGLIDDLHNLKALFKLFIQILAAFCVTAGGFLIRSISIPYMGSISFGIFAYPITILWIVGIANAINLVDGMDGLAGGISAFASLSMGIIALIQKEYMTALFAFSLFGAVFAFLVFNFPPARIFMGDSGSLLIGFTLSLFPLMGISKAASFGTLIIPITLLTIPIIDTLAAIIRRLKRGRPIISPDKDHIHHKLMDMGMSEKKILTIIYSFCFYLSIVSITSVILPKETNVYLIFIVWIGSMMGYYFLDYARFKKLSKTENMENGEKQKKTKNNFLA